MTLSPFDKRLLEEGLGYFDRPRLASLLETLGPTRFERLETLVTMLRNSPPEEFDEAIALFERAAVRAARQRESDEPDRARSSKSAERRAQRRRST